MKSKMIVCLWALVGLMPMACVFFGSWVFWRATDRPTLYMVDPGGTVFQAFLVAVPFAALALIAPSRLQAEARGISTALLVAAASGCLVTTGLWALYYYSGYVYWKHHQVTGAAIGSGCVMCASPLLVGVVMYVAYRLSRLAKG